MDEQKAVVPAGAVRERVIQVLTDAFANDQITVAELEDRLEKVYRAATAAEAEALIAGLTSLAAAKALGQGSIRREVALDRDRASERIVSVFSSQSRRGVWSVPRDLHVLAVFSDTALDLTNASLPAEIIDLHVNVVFASLRIVVPSGLRVVNRVGAFAASVESDASLDLAPMVPGSPVIRITGTATFASLEIVAGPRIG